MPRFPLVRQALTVCCFPGFQRGGFRPDNPGGTPASGRHDSALSAEKQFLDVKEIQTSGRFFMFNRGEVSQSDLYVRLHQVSGHGPDRVRKGEDKACPINRGLEGWNINPPKKGRIPEVEEQSVARLRRVSAGLQDIIRLHDALCREYSQGIDFEDTGAKRWISGGRTFSRFAMPRRTCCGYLSTGKPAFLSRFRRDLPNETIHGRTRFMPTGTSSMA